MKLLLSLLLLAVVNVTHAGEIDRNYGFSDTDGAENIQVFNDGKNTIFDSLPGLVIRGATADGPHLIVPGTPSEIRGALNGQALTVSRFSLAKRRGAEPKRSDGDVDAVSAKIAALESKLSLEESKLNPTLAATVAAAAPIPSPEIAKPDWILTAGKTIGQELQAWAQKAGWKVIWSLPKDWTVPTTTTFSGEFEAVSSDVIKTLAANGALVRAQFYAGNKTLLVTGPGVNAQ